MKFTKMHGIGNDYVYVDCLKKEEEIQNPSQLARMLSDRNFGIGADGLILIYRGETLDFRMEMYNADGSRGKTCGNGLRCMAKYLYDRKLAEKESFWIETDAGSVLARVTTSLQSKVESVEVNMGEPILEAHQIPILGFSGSVILEPMQVLDRNFFFTAVSMGNPHCVIFFEDNKKETSLEKSHLESFSIERYSTEIQKTSMFPEGVNIEWVEVTSPREVSQRTWERGSGETLACGSGACAVLVAGVLTKKTEKSIQVHLKGGTLDLRWENNSIWMKGPAKEVFEGIWK